MARWRDDDDSDFEDSEEDFESPDESDLGDEDSQTQPCPYCGEDVYEEAERCPYCGRDLSQAGSRTPRWVWLTAILLVAIIIYATVHWLL